MVCTIKISPLGYMLLMEEGTLEKGDGGDGHSFHRDGYFPWIGPVHKSRSVISKGTTHAFVSVFKMSLRRSFENERHPVSKLCKSEMTMSMGVLHRIQCAQRVNEGFTKLTASDQLSFSVKISYAPFVGFASHSLMC